MKKRIGILGGTFSPVHKGHIGIAEKALEEFALEEVWFVVDGIPPHKENVSYVTRFQRYEMTGIAIAGHKGFVLKDFELYDIEKSYTALTLGRLVKRFPDCEFFFIMGEDSIDAFDQWREPEVISGLAHILVAPRSDNNNDLDEKLYSFNKIYPGDFSKINAVYVPVSSTKLREGIMNGDMSFVEKYIPDGVYDYIKEHRVYAIPTVYDTDGMRRELMKVLDEKRFYHSLRVADTAAALADTYHFPQGVAYAAGLLHDCGKHYTDAELILYCKQHGIPVSKTQESAGYLLHGPVGAHIARTKYGVCDEDMLGAITYHTTGCARMSLLQKMIFVADYIEPGRKRSKMLDIIRPMSYKDINTAILMILEETFEFLRSGGRNIDETAMEAYKYYKETEHECD